MDDVDGHAEEMEHVTTPSKTKATRALAAAVFFLLLGSFSGVRLLARRLVFRGQGGSSEALPADLVPLEATAKDGAAVHAAELRAGPDAPTLVHFHDNRQTLTSNIELARAIVARGISVVLVEYRGYGASGALSPSEDALYADAEAVLDVLARRGVPASRVILSGRSLGTGVAAEMARRGRGGALVLIAPFTSIPDLVRESVAWAPADWMVPDAFDTGAKTGDIKVPTLIVHGDRDDVVPIGMGVALSGAIAHARLVRVEGAGHGDVVDRSLQALLAGIESLARALRK